MFGYVDETLDLSLLAGEGKQCVEGEVGERECSLHSHVSDVAYVDLDVLSPGLGAHLGDHVFGDVDSDDLDSPFGQRNSEPAGADRKLQGSRR